MLHYTIAPFCVTRQKREYSNTQIWSSYETDKTFSFKFDFNFNLNSQSTFHEHRKSSNNLRCWRATEAFIRRPQVREMHTWAMQKKRSMMEVEIEFEIEFENWNRETAGCDAESSSAWRLEFDFWNLEFKNLLLKNQVKKSLRVILNSDCKFKIVSRSIT